MWFALIVAASVTVPHILPGPLSAQLSAPGGHFNAAVEATSPATNLTGIEVITTIAPANPTLLPFGNEPACRAALAAIKAEVGTLGGVCFDDGR